MISWHWSKVILSWNHRIFLSRLNVSLTRVNRVYYRPVPRSKRRKPPTNCAIDPRWFNVYWIVKRIMEPIGSCTTSPLHLEVHRCSHWRDSSSHEIQRNWSTSTSKKRSPMFPIERRWSLGVRWLIRRACLRYQRQFSIELSSMSNLEVGVDSALIEYQDQ